MKIKSIFNLYIILYAVTLKGDDMLKKMSIMMGSQLGASIGNQSVTSEYQTTFQAIGKNQTNINNALSSFAQNVSLATTAQTTSIVNLYSQATKEVNTLMNQQNTLSAQLQNYLSSMISLQTAPQQYLASPTHHDQLFTNGTMYTPQGLIWKNIYQIGNWQFDETSNSFWQMSHVPIATPTTNAYKNSIFTEWITQNPYEISCDVTIYKVSYPFYVGVIFNKARWISGDTYGIQKYRTIGICGNETKQISIQYAQQIIPPTTTTASSPTPQYPLDQVLTSQKTLPVGVDATALASLKQQALTIHFKIKPSVTAIAYKVWINAEIEPTSYTVLHTQQNNSKAFKKNLTSTVTITGPDNYSATYLASNYNDLYLYHGIGFLSPGAIAQFKLNSPEQLLFTPNAIKAFTAEFDTYLKKLSASSTSQNLAASNQTKVS